MRLVGVGGAHWRHLDVIARRLAQLLAGAPQQHFQGQRSGSGAVVVVAAIAIAVDAVELK